MNSWSTRIAGFQAGSMSISGEQVATRAGELPHSNLRYWPKNPRIYSIVHAAGETDPLDQDEIQLELQGREHVRELIQDVRHHGGLLNPVIVRDQDFVVLEGNSRLAAYRFLAQKDPVKFGLMKCIVFPSDIPEKLIYGYLNQEHIKGKSEWSPYEQAGVIFRLVESGTDLEVLARELNIGKRVAKRMHETYCFMVEHKEDRPSRWSYYEVYLQNRKVADRRETETSLDRRIIKEIRSEKLTAQEFRDMLPEVCSNEKSFRAFLSEKSSLQGAYEHLESEGKTEDLVKSLKRINERVRSLTKEDFDELKPKAAKVAEFEVTQIIRKLSSLRDKVFGKDPNQR